MDLKAAILCIDCEWVYERSSACPRCGSQVAFPLSRALAGRMAAKRAATTFIPPLASQARPLPGPRLPAVERAESAAWREPAQPKRSVA